MGAGVRFDGAIRLTWSRFGEDAIYDGRLVEPRGTHAVLLTPNKQVAPDEELRLVLSDGAGNALSVGVAVVRAIDEAGVHVELFSLGIDDDLLTATTRPRVQPPPLPKRPLAMAPPIERDDFSGRDYEPVHETEVDGAAPLVEPLAVRRGLVIGIDLGTTNTCACYVVDGQPKIIPGRTGTNTIPSMITFDPDGSFHVGQRALDRHVLHPLRTVYGSKRLIGRTYRPELAAELQAHFAYPLGEAEGQRFGVRIDERVISMDTIAARVLDEVRSCAEANLGVPVEAAIITVPAYFSEVQREAVRRAAAQAKLAVYRIVNEPTAAAVAYGHKLRERARVAVWDFGGGTFDFSIVDVTQGQLEVVATGGDNFVGGTDFDDLLAGHLLAEFRREHGLTFDPDPQQIARLRDAAEHAKRMLSVEDEHVVSIPELTRSPRRDLELEITREQFEAITRPLIDRTLAIANEVMRTAGVAPTAIDDVLLVGGTTRVPAVQKAVADLFQRRPSKRINPDEAVAIGAALLAEEIGSGTAPTLVDILPMTVGRGVHGRAFTPIVKRYASVPTTQEITLDADLLGSVYVPLFQGESQDVSQNEYLCSVVIEDRSLWDGGRVIVRLSFDEHCTMTVDALDARTRRPLPVKLDRSRPVEDVLRELGGFQGPPQEVAWQPPQSALGKALGKLFKLFGRG